MTVWTPGLWGREISVGKFGVGRGGDGQGEGSGMSAGGEQGAGCRQGEGSGMSASEGEPGYALYPSVQVPVPHLEIAIMGAAAAR